MLVEERKVNMSLDPRPVSGTLYGLEAGLQPIGTDFLTYGHKFGFSTYRLDLLSAPWKR